MLRNIQYRTFSIFVIYLLASCTSMLFAQRNKKPAPVKIDTVYIIPPPLDKSPVIPFTDTIFYVYGNIGAFTSTQRAESIESKIRELAEDYFFKEDSIKFAEFSGYLNIMYQENILMSVDSIQAAQEGKTRLEAAQLYQERIVKTIQEQLYNTSWERILIQVFGVIAILLIESLLIKLIFYAYKRLRVTLRLQRGKKIRGFFGIIDDQRATLIAISFLKFLRFLFIIALLYLGLLVIFKLFPYTKHLSDELLSYVVTPAKSFVGRVIAYMPKLFSIIVIIVIFRYLQKFIRSIAEKVAKNKIQIRGFYPDWAFPTYNIASVLLFVLMFILIYPNLPQSNSQVFQGVSVMAGLMLSLGSTSIIGNLVAGLVITYMRPFKIGDRIKIGEFTGDVLEKTALVTRIKTPKNEIITIPNSNVMSAQTVNYSTSARTYGLILYINISVSYSIPWQKIHGMLHEVANRTENLSKKQKPFILQDRFNDFDVEYQLNVYIRDAKLTSKVYSDLRQHAQDVFAENNIEMVSPHYEITRHTDTNDSTVPSKDKREDVNDHYKH